MVSSDARSLTDIDALAAQVKAEFETIDLLFVNAGFSIPTPIANVTEAIYDEMFRRVRGRCSESALLRRRASCASRRTEDP